MERPRMLDRDAGGGDVRADHCMRGLDVIVEFYNRFHPYAERGVLTYVDLLISAATYLPCIRGRRDLANLVHHDDQATALLSPRVLPTRSGSISPVPGSLLRPWRNRFEHVKTMHGFTILAVSTSSMRKTDCRVMLKRAPFRRKLARPLAPHPETRIMHQLALIDGRRHHPAPKPSKSADNSGPLAQLASAPR